MKKDDAEKRQAREFLRIVKPFLPWMAVSSAAGMTASAATVALLALINRVLAGNESMTAGVLWHFLGLCAAALVMEALSSMLASRTGQRLVAALRRDLARKILSAPIDALERYRSHRLMPVLTEDVDMIAYVLSSELANLLISIVTAIGCLSYLAWLSPSLFGMLFLALVLGTAMQLFAQARGIEGFDRARDQEEYLHKAYRGVSDGAKELRLHRGRRLFMFNARIRAATERIQAINSKAFDTYALAGAYGSALYFLLIALLLGWAAFQGIERSVLSGFVLIVLYLKGPIDHLLGTIPNAGQAIVAFRRITDLSTRFRNPEPDLLPDPLTSNQQQENPRLKSTIELKGVCYEFPATEENARGFALGPLDLVLKKGELVFVVGENGSGKTSFIKLLLGLYAPQRGEIRVDGVTVTPATRDDYRQLFSTVFSDFFLFEELMPASIDGDPHISSVSTWLERLGIAHKVAIRNGAFSTLDLSTGQRKRLALIHAYIEGRDVLVFDEWAADQDPGFRHLFYTELLPALRRQGHLLVVISHDDRYFDRADRIVRLAGGRVIEDRRS